MRKQILFILMIAISFTAAKGQLSRGEALDKIIAVVGNEIILQSDVLGQLALMAQQNPRFDATSQESFQEILDALINEKLLITKAIEDSVVVTDEQIEARWQVFLHTLMQQFGSEQRIEQVYKKSLNRLKFELRDDIRNKLLSSNLVQNKIANISISAREVMEFYRDYKDSLPKVPETVEVYHIVKYITANEDEKQKVLRLARAVRDSILRGGNFEDFAERYSDDDGTAQSGGDLGWINKGRFFAEFENAAFALQINEVSMPVETPFGYHIIQVLDKRKESINLRHILFKITQSGDDKDNVVRFLDSLKNIAVENNNFSELALIHSDDRDTKGFGGLIGRMPLSELPANFRSHLSAMKDGDISEPIPYNIDATKPAIHIIWKKRSIPEHLASIEEDYDYIENMALDIKKMKTYNDFIEQLRRELYWELK